MAQCVVAVVDRLDLGMEVRRRFLAELATEMREYVDHGGRVIEAREALPPPPSWDPNDVDRWSQDRDIEADDIDERDDAYADWYESRFLPSSGRVVVDPHVPAVGG